jgi:hypothetical protein
MNWLYYLTEFGLGSVKYLFSQWGAYAYIKNVDNVDFTFLNIFIPTYLGAVFGMSVFYFLSDFLMERAAEKRMRAYILAKDEGVKLKIKRKFTRMNKFMVKAKSRFGIYALTFIAPLFFSIPIGSIICAKFYGDRKKTFPLMMMFTGIYGLIMTSIIILIYG